jgi:pimeloyl-ACP methyl ester carboxylesterase
VNELLLTEISDEKKSDLQNIAKELKKIENSNYHNFYEDVNWMLHEVSPQLGFNAYFADTTKIISLNDVLNDTALLNLMNYSKEEFLKIGEKAAFVNQVFLDGDEYNTINIENELATIKTPVSVIQGEFDYVVGLGHAELIYNALSGLSTERKELHIIPETGHCPAIENPKRLSEILIEFFEKNDN